MYLKLIGPLLVLHHLYFQLGKAGIDTKMVISINYYGYYYVMSFTPMK